MEAIIFDLWDTLVPLPAQVRAAAIERRGEALDLPIANLRDALAATWTRRATGLLRPVIEDIYRERLGRSPSPEQIATALRARREVNASAFVPADAAIETLRSQTRSSTSCCWRDLVERERWPRLVPILYARQRASNSWRGTTIRSLAEVPELAETMRGEHASSTPPPRLTPSERTAYPQLPTIGICDQREERPD